MKIKKTLCGASINQKQFKKWMEALRSGEYSQTRHYLNDKRGYCCLGVACEILIPEKKKRRDSKGFIEGMLPNEQNAPRWLKHISDDLDERLNDAAGGDDYEDNHLPALNDDEKLNFNELADILEAVYIHGVLE
jgi:hypothetical protein